MRTLFAALVLCLTAPASAQIAVDTSGSMACTAEGSATEIVERCTSGAGAPIVTRFTCAPMIAVDLGPGAGLESVVSCAAVVPEGEMPEGLVAILSAGRLSWAMERSSIEGVFAEAMALRHDEPRWIELLLHIGSEDGATLAVVAWTGHAFAVVLRATTSGGMADPDATYRVSYLPGATATVEIVRRVGRARPERTTWRWAPGTSAFVSTTR